MQSPEPVNVSRISHDGVFDGLFGNPCRTIEEYRGYFRHLLATRPEECEWLSQQIRKGRPLHCAGCVPGSRSCHARIIEQEILFDEQQKAATVTSMTETKPFLNPRSVIMHMSETLWTTCRILCPQSGPEEAPPDALPDLTIHRVPVISTHHMTEEDDRSLVRAGINLDDQSGGEIAVMPGGNGYLVRCGDPFEDYESLPSLSKSFDETRQFMHFCGFRMFILDADGQVLPGLTFNEW